MNSIFDDEDALYGYATQLGPVVKRVPSNVSVIVNTDMTYQEPALPYRKRTVGEALQRARSVSGPARALKSFPPLAPYAYLFQGVSIGLILIDPLDRLEGGLID